MNKKLKIIGILLAVLCVSVIFISGCAKEQTVKDETLVSQEQEAVSAEEAAQQAAEREALLKEQEEARMAQEAREIELQEAAAFEDIRFDFDKYDLKAETRGILREHADWLLAHADFEVIVEGHCDERGTREYNLALGERRAEATRDYLVNLGVDNARLTTISYGEELPVDSRHTEEAWAKNRRCHFVVVSEEK